MYVTNHGEFCTTNEPGLDKCMLPTVVNFVQPMCQGWVNVVTNRNGFRYNIIFLSRTVQQVLISYTMNRKLYSNIRH